MKFFSDIAPGEWFYPMGAPGAPVPDDPPLHRKIADPSTSANAYDFAANRMRYIEPGTRVRPSFAPTRRDYPPEVVTAARLIIRHTTENYR